MSLADSITTSYTRKATHYIEVAGHQLWNVTQGHVAFSLDSPVPEGEITLDSIPSWVNRNDPVAVSSGTARNAVIQILGDVGMTDYALDIAAWTLGVVQPAIIDLKSPG